MRALGPRTARQFSNREGMTLFVLPLASNRLLLAGLWIPGVCPPIHFDSLRNPWPHSQLLPRAGRRPLHGASHFTAAAIAYVDLSDRTTLLRRQIHLNQFDLMWEGELASTRSGLCTIDGIARLEMPGLGQRIRQAAGGAGQAEFGQVVSEHAVDVVEVGGSKRSLGLHDFDIVRNSRGKFLPCQLQRLLRHLNVAFSNLHLAGRGLKIEEGVADLRFDLSLQVVGFGAALCRSGVGLLDIAFHAPALPDRQTQGAGHGKSPMRLRRVSANHAVIAFQRERQTPCAPRRVSAPPLPSDRSVAAGPAAMLAQRSARERPRTGLHRKSRTGPWA